MRRQLPIFIVFLTGLIMVLQYFSPHPISEFIFTYANDFVIVIGILAGGALLVTLAAMFLPLQEPERH